MSADQESRLHPFASLYRHGFVRVAAAVPHVRIGDPVFNAERTLALARQASDAGAALVIFPELGISGYSIDDLLHQTALLDSVVAAIGRIAEGSESMQPAIVVGAPLRAEYGVFNAAVVIHRGSVLGVVPKSYLPEYREYYEKRQFRAARDLVGDRIRVGSSAVPFGTDLLFASRDLPPFIFHVEICEDLWAPIPPELVRRARRRDRARQPFGQQHHDRQGQLPPRAVRVAVRPDDRRLRVHRRRHGRVHDRPRLGRPRPDL